MSQKHTRSTKTQKQFVFLIRSGTVGDQKPLALLAVHTAHAISQLEEDRYPPVKVICEVWDITKWYPCIEKFAEYLMGPDYTQWFQTEFRVTEPVTLTELKNSIVFKSTTFQGEPRQDNAVFLDFGDNEESMNRFTSVALKIFRPDSIYFGSLYLPLDDKLAWSSEDAMEELKGFCTKHIAKGKKIVTLAGSLTPPFDLQELVDWQNQDQSNEWVILLIGYTRWIEFMNLGSKMNPDKMYAMKHYIQFEDLMRCTDFFISNCGAGSVMIPFAAGCMQMCASRGQVGSDKTANETSVSEIYNVGPASYRGNKRLNFFEVMSDIQQNISTYEANALKAQSLVSSETSAAHWNWNQMFKALCLNAKLQNRMLKSGFLPQQYSLTHGSL